MRVHPNPQSLLVEQIERLRFLPNTYNEMLRIVVALMELANYPPDVLTRMSVMLEDIWLLEI